ncbi:hypothetical protein BVRB_8g186460 [Beta vulgaris subsp. vulgaris]|uniref:Pentacotripeptide-repeat region of PRORP domain-containing protein n=1 Tax=Beta vulgaris subsp. vulgaris TaxID=3555 RepID=A0A0J8BVP6_BETVV|nr:hypothetical protein BVRB_8g186460 [Beta vulgaris subsp. vulgaris]
MSNVYTRLHCLFSSNRNSANSIKSKLPQIQNPKPTKSTPNINADINQGVKELLDERDSKKLVEKFTSLSEHKYFRTKHRIYGNIIHRLTLSKQLSLIEYLLESQKIYISGEAFAARIIFLYGKAGLFEHAHKLFDELPDRGFEQSDRTFSALLGAGCNSGNFDKVYELFQEVPVKLAIKLSMDSYNAALHALCKLGLFDDAVALLDVMEEKGLKPSVCSLNTVLGAFYEKGEFEKGEKIWERMIGSGVVPDMISYNFKLQKLVSEGKISEAMELIMELESKGLNPNVGTYNALIIGSCKHDDLDGVRRWYTELMSRGCIPNRVTFHTIVPFLCDKGDYSLAFQVCKRMFRRQCSVDKSLLQKVVDGLAKNSMIDEANILVGLGRSNSFFPYNLVLPNQGVVGFFL